MNQTFVSTFLVAGGVQVLVYLVLLVTGVARKGDAPLANIYLKVYGFRQLNAMLDGLGFSGGSAPGLRLAGLLTGFILIIATYAGAIALMVTAIRGVMAAGN